MHTIRYSTILLLLVTMLFLSPFLSTISKVLASSQVLSSSSEEGDKNNSNLTKKNIEEEKKIRVHTVHIVKGSVDKKGQVQEPFSPSSLSISTGDTVKWINDDNVEHSVTSLLFKSDIIPPFSNQSSRAFEFKFEQPGTYVYVDRLHPYMAGVILVDVTQSQRQLISTTGEFIDIKVEIPRNAAYKNNYGPSFIPTNTFIPSNANLTWTNQDYVAHTATSAEGSFDTEAILPGQSKTIKLNHNPGTMSYYCKIHPWMLGTITVSK
ncbi:MAG TPA: hypothetical protein VE130_00025 [Nitrososphaeraceae archaeon]|nr:hypothetical protein [Nitrososphaeraceae archaeon]